jgi:hypothetical protein
MPCTPAKARHLFKSGKARPKRNKLGLFYVQLCYEQEPDNQPLVVGIDPGSKFEGYSVVGTQQRVLNLMVEAPDHVKEAIQTRRTMPRARRHRKWRRPKRFDNRLNRKQRIPPSTRRKDGLQVHLKEGWQTKALRERYGLKKTKSKSKPSFESHAVDGWVLAASVSGAPKPTCTKLWYVVGAVLHRRQLHRLQASKGGERKPYGGTRSLGYKRGTLVRHSKYGICTVGGFDRKRQTISLHAYRTNKRLTQGAKGKDSRTLTPVAWRAFLVVEPKPKKAGKESPPLPCPKKGTPASPPASKDGGLPRRSR